MVSLGLHEGVGQTVFFLEIQGVNLFPLLIQAPETPTLLGAPPPASANPSGILPPSSHGLSLGLHVPKVHSLQEHSISD